MEPSIHKHWEVVAHIILHIFIAILFDTVQTHIRHLFRVVADVIKKEALKGFGK